MEMSFSIEVDSKLHIRNVTLSDDAHGKVLFEGTLGKLEGLSFVDDVVLELKGTHGVLRVDVEERAFRNVLSKRKLVA